MFENVQLKSLQGMFIFIANGQMQHPFGKIYNSAGTVYEGKIEFRQEISGQKAVTCAGSIWHRNNFIMLVNNWVLLL